MKLNIKSKQIYETHTDEITEEYEAKINFFENGFEICYDICKIKLENDCLYIEKPEMKLKIIKETETKNLFKTPYGNIEILVKGIDYTWNDNPFQLDLKYILKLGNTTEYINELQMSILDKK